MKPTLLPRVVIALLCLSLGACAGQQAAALLVDRSGNQADFGVAASAGAQLATAKGDLQRAEGRGAGGITMVEMDCGSSPDQARAAAQNVAREAFCGIGFTDSDEALAGVQPFVAAKRPFMVIGATDPTLPKRCGAGVFMACFGDDAQATAAAMFGAKRFGKRCAVVTDSAHAYTRGLTRYFRQAYEREGGSVVLQMDRRDPNARREIAAMKARGDAFDFVFLAGEPDELSALLGLLRDALPGKPILGGDGLDCSAVATSGTAPSDGVFFTTHAWFGEGASPEAKAFADAYTQAYGTPPSNAFAALGYDAVMLVQVAARRAGGTTSPDPKALSKAIGEIRNWQGVTGEFNFSNGPVPRKDVWIVEVRNGQRRLAQRMPAPLPLPVRQPM
jgi:branched-chain amino acid transport system substrate-binding protein